MTLEFLIYGLIFGLLGQAIRSFVGLKKARENYRSFDWKRLVGSLFAGALAGAATVLGIASIDTTGSLNVEPIDIVTIMTAGYAGTDFLEGFFKGR